MIDHSSPTSCITYSQSIRYIWLCKPAKANRVRCIGLLKTVNADSFPTVPDYCGIKNTFRYLARLKEPLDKPCSTPAEGHSSSRRRTGTGD